MTEPLLDVTGVTKVYRTSRWPAPPLRTVAVDDVSLQVQAGESVGIVGESGSGKSTLAGTICGLVKPDSGTIRLDGQDLYPRGKFDREAWRSLQLVFQDPYTSLNPGMTLEDTVAEPVRNWRGASDREARKVAREMLDLVGLGDAFATRRPGNLSGGQRQRASIARALAVSPKMIVLDESVSALDVSVQAQILELLLELRRERNLTYLLISHDIGVIRLFCDRVVVMQHGKIVEACTSDELTLDGVQEPYTRQLLSAVPVLRAAS
ncbi:ABC transporter ATP-binding protein [Gordonia rhizosphera]|uniref:Putative ABC transporter ATP-binding protein n=1 Tax=Gordonia rhizosphera NBRC 16068 TaxID=1108045 RepID=K6WXV5_9ACTN|nr:ATP-binding cassette domain-containing protein [Gordonia rhizosphera]GAB91369.1 putative ABC transporter ATP-binding protein [Gordonia rhizosphera NBRC 16068]